MRKLIFALITAIFILGACSSANSSYQKNLKKSIKQMNEMDYDTAITTLNTMLEKDLPGDRFEPKRTEIVEDLIDESEYMKEHIDSLTSAYETAMKVYENVELQDIDSLATAYSELQYALDAFGDMTQLDMHQELSDALSDVETGISELIANFEKDFHDGIDNADFSKSSTALELLRYAADILPGSYPGDIYEKYEELHAKYNAEIEKYAQLPMSVTAWDEEIVKNELGTVQLIGARSAGDLYEIFIKLSDDHAKAGSNIKLSPELITKNGNKMSSYSSNQVNYKDYTMLVYTFDNYDNEPVENIVRADFGNESDFSVDFTGKPDDLVDIPGVKTITGTFSPNLSLKHDNYTVNVNDIEVNKEEMIFTGTIEPTKDIELRDFHGIYFPISHEVLTSGNVSFASYDEYYRGTNQEFSIHTSLNNPITEFNDTVRMQIYNKPFAFNFAEEKEIELEKSEFIHNILSNTVALPYYNQGIDKVVKNQDKKTVDSESLLYLDRYVSDHTIELGNNYKTLTTTLHITEDGKDEDYEEIEVNFYSYNPDGDNELLHSEVLKGKHKAKDIKFDVKGVDRLIITFNIPYSASFPGIILEKPFVE